MLEESESHKHRVPARRHLGLMSARDLFDSAEPRARDLFTMSPPTLLTRQTTSDRDADLVYALALAETEERQARENASMTYAQRGILDDRADIEDEVDGCEFFFLPASTIRHTQRFTPTGITELPRFQELRERHLVRRFVSRREAMSQRGELRETCLAVSHRWESTLRPDVTGDQFRAIRAYLDEHPQIEYVWVDWSSMPQKGKDGDERTREEEALFKKMLRQVNLLFLGCSVLLLVDISFCSRFWTMFEAWLAMQAASADGLSPERERSRRRYTIKCLHTAALTDRLSRVHEQQIAGILGDATPEEVFTMLSAPDVQVTNQKDKDEQLPKLLRLSEDVRQYLGRRSFGSRVGGRLADLLKWFASPLRPVIFERRT